MDKTLIMLPESYPVARLLCEYVFKEHGGSPDLLILKKQRAGFERILKEFDFNKVYEIDEEYYGRITGEESAAFIRERMKSPYDVAYFPFNTFRANAFLFGSVIAREVKAVNSSLYHKKELPIVSFKLSGGKRHESNVPWAPIMDEVVKAKDRIVSILEEKQDSFEVSGERPTFGILHGFAHDLEIFCKYALGSMYSMDKKVLDIGGGLGFGSFLLSKFADKTFFVDRSKDAVNFVEKMWVENSPNIVPICGDADSLYAAEASFDVIFLMDVIEHVPDPQDVLNKVNKLLKKDGKLIITTPEEDYYPYSVCPKERWSDPEDKLISEAIWPWHIQALGEEKLLPMLKKADFMVEEKSYTTYVKGYDFQSELRKASERGDDASVIRSLNDLTKWDIRDFGLTTERDPYFSAASYNVVARKAS
ncbi:MAG: methyltransferase domain-containing protein [Deltaproteobacteria bacterium]|nr:methyltransferase domain-containing protein [Deltaproteobacteria bacterium]